VWLVAGMLAIASVASCASRGTSTVRGADHFFAVRQAKDLPSEAREAKPSNAGQMKILAISDVEQIALRPASVVVSFHPVRDAGSLDSAIQGRSRGDRRLYLVLKQVRAAKQPGVLFHLYLDLPPGRVPSRHDPRHVGVLNFFEAVQPSDFESQKGNAAVDLSYDITDVADNLSSKNLLTHPTTVTIIATKDFPIDAQPLIGQIAIAEQ
jgi:hypothetical protein